VPVEGAKKQTLFVLLLTRFLAALTWDACFCSDELKEKAKQKRLKGSADMQAARRREKEQRMLAEKQSREMEAAEFAADPQAFLANLVRAREALAQTREERAKAEADGSGGTGRRSVAAKKRASLLAAMAGSGGSIESIEKNARKDRLAFQKEAAFGMRDEDWKVYEDVRMVRSTLSCACTVANSVPLPNGTRVYFVFFYCSFFFFL
jgi:hypothetical protein